MSALPLRPHTTRRIGGPRTAVILLLVAIVPLAGVAWVSWRAVREARDVDASAAATEQYAEAAADLARLDGAMFDEMVWRAIGALVSTLDAPPDVVASFLGADPAAEIARTTTATDQAVAAAGATDVAAALTGVRSSDLDMPGVLAAQRQMSTLVGDDLGTLLEALTSSPLGATDTRALVSRVDDMRDAVAARGAVAQMFYGYFASVFDLRDSPTVEVSRLVASRSEFDQDMQSLRTSAETDPTMRDLLAALDADGHLTSFVQAIDALVAASFTNGLPATAPAMSLDSVMANYDGFDTIYRSADGASKAMLALVDGSAARVIDAVADVRDDATREIDRAYQRAALLTLMTLLSALLAARFIVQPLSDLRQAASDLESGHEQLAGRIGGPVEVKAAALALRDASAHIDLVTRQARSLAVGDLDAEVLDEVAPGGLGDALQEAVAHVAVRAGAAGRVPAPTRARGSPRRADQAAESQRVDGTALTLARTHDAIRLDPRGVVHRSRSVQGRQRPSRPPVR